MKGNLLLLLSLLCGIGLGAADATLGECIRHYALPTCLLALLVLQVGIGLGSNGDLGALLRSFRWQMLLLPVFTIVGTLSFTALAALLFPSTGIMKICRRRALGDSKFPRGMKKVGTLQEIYDFIDYWDAERKNLPVATDGIVLKVNSQRQQRALGYTAKSPAGPSLTNSRPNGPERGWTP